MGNLAGWKRLIEIVPSKSNGITFDCGVTRELGEDPVEVCRYFGSRDRINHVHFRNVRVQKPREKYTEVFLDEGQVDMFAVMKELVRQKYPRLDLPGASARARCRPRSGRLQVLLPGRRILRRLCLQCGLHSGDAASRFGVIAEIDLRQKA